MNFSPDAFRALAGQRLRADAPHSWERSDDDMNARARMIPPGVVPKPAAVLIGLVEGADGLELLLTQRHAGLKKHAGQIAFPGGKLDAGETALEAALREADEEVGLSSRFVEPLGFLDGYLTVTGYFVTPLVAMVRDGHTLAAQVGEVDEIFHVPLSFVLDDRNRRIDTREWNGVTRHYYVYPYGERYIWGATAGMITNLGERLNGTKA